MRYINTKIEEEAYDKMFESIKSVLESYQEDFDFNGDNQAIEFVASILLDDIFDVVASYAKYEIIQ